MRHTIAFTVLTTGIALTTLAHAQASGYWTETTPNLGPNVNTRYREATPALSADGLIMVFAAERPDGEGDFDLYEVRRSSVDEPFGEAIHLANGINTVEYEGDPSLSADGLTLYFVTQCRRGGGSLDLWVAARPSRDESFAAPMNLDELLPGSRVNSGYTDRAPSISRDGLTLLFSSNRPGGAGGLDIWVSTRAALDAPFGEPVNLNELAPGVAINTALDETYPSQSSDSRTILFSSHYRYASGEKGPLTLWSTTRSARGGFSALASLLGPDFEVEGDSFGGMASVSDDWPQAGAKLYFVTRGLRIDSSTDIREATWTPAGASFRRGDIDGDGEVNVSDAVASLGYLFGGASRPYCLQAADTDDTGSIDISDAVYLLAHLFAEGPAPAAPFESCGHDVTPDGLGCEGYTGCR